MDEIGYSFGELRKLEEEIIKADKKRRNNKILNKAVKLYKKLAEADEKLNSPNRTKADFKRRTKILTEICVLFRKDEGSAALDEIKREAELLSSLHVGLKRLFENILSNAN
ncbi:MAG: hypothetical protein K2L67_00865 [Clostridia bacterium]|nr:hypothetical protein [Clostridia bacterium]